MELFVEVSRARAGTCRFDEAGKPGGAGQRDVLRLPEGPDHD
jgi:hypothetical protein